MIRPSPRGLSPEPGVPPRWVRAPATQVLAALRPLFPGGLLSEAARIAAIAVAVVEAAVLYVVVLTLARKIAARSRQQSAPPASRGAP